MKLSLDEEFQKKLQYNWNFQAYISTITWLGVALRANK